MIDTTVGRALLFQIVPDGLPFDVVNQKMTKEADFQADSEPVLPDRWPERNRNFC
jgi:hypothetical protein